MLAMDGFFSPFTASITLLCQTRRLPYASRLTRSARREHRQTLGIRLADLDPVEDAAIRALLHSAGSSTSDNPRPNANCSLYHNA